MALDIGAWRADNAQDVPMTGVSCHHGRFAGEERFGDMAVAEGGTADLVCVCAKRQHREVNDDVRAVRFGQG